MLDGSSPEDIDHESLTEVPLHGYDKPPKRRGYKGEYRYCPDCGGEVFIEKKVSYHSTILFKCEGCEWKDGWLG